jgi:PadR family transcriptional regulator AphA
MDELKKKPGRNRIRSEFLATMLFGDLLSPSQLDDVIETKLAEYRNELANMEACDMSGSNAGNTFVHGFGISFYRAAITYMEEHSHTVIGGAFLSTPPATSMAKDGGARSEPVTPREAAE